MDFGFVLHCVHEFSDSRSTTTGHHGARGLARVYCSPPGPFAHTATGFLFGAVKGDESPYSGVQHVRYFDHF